MGGYRTLKRALGETNIERKCRILFGVCLAVLVGASFLGVYRICGNLVDDVTHRAGADAVDSAVVYLHWEFWQTGPDPDKTIVEDAKEFRAKFANDLRMKRFQSNVLRLQGEQNNPNWFQIDKAIPPANDLETSILDEMHTKWKEILSRRESTVPPPTKSKETPSGARTSEVQTVSAEDEEWPFKLMSYPEHGWNYYYQPVNWTKSCLPCHHLPLAGSLSASDVEAFKSEPPPFRVVRVRMGYEETKKAMQNVQATLAATWIFTVFVAMLGLYVIVKYVIVKPLTHLRDVSEAISQGKTQRRADIHTNDEFEDLADAFNRMLRHLTDAQEQLQSINAKLDAKVDELAQANMQLYDMNRLKSDFLANMSHELRTPLNSIIGFSDVLQGIESLNDKQRRYAQNIQKSGRVLLDMINDILDLAKLEAGKMELRPSEFRLDAVINAQCDMMRSLTEDKNIDLEVISDAEAPPIYQDQGKVQQILTNLLSNAIKFTPEGGRITVRAEQLDDDHLELTVADTGVGIPEEDRDIIFEKFRQSKTVLGTDTLTREYSGTGLGLSIVKELCKLLGGEISFTSELGKGSTFRVVLPWSLPNRSRANAISSKLAEPSTLEPRSTAGNVTAIATD